MSEILNFLKRIQLGIAGLQNTALNHHTRHENTGSDEINVAGLSGELADQQRPKVHALTHRKGETDDLESSLKLGNLNEKSHNSLDDVTPNQHHNQSHSLTSHTTKAHSELTGVTSDQHHARAHTLASHSTKAHSELTGVAASQHHTKTGLDDTPVNGQTAEGITSNWAYDHKANANAHHAQSHTLASHSTKAHSELTGVTASQHHSKTVSSDIDHGHVTGLQYDHHTQYLNNARHDVTARHPKSVLKTGTHSATNLSTETNILMYEYSFFPNMHSDGGGEVNLWIWKGSAPDDYRGRLCIAANPGQYVSDYYGRYLSASGPPQIWIVRDKMRNLYAIWESDDPAPCYPEPPIECFDKNRKRIGETILVVLPEDEGNPRLSSSSFKKVKKQALTDLAIHKGKGRPIGKILLHEYKLDEVDIPKRPAELPKYIKVRYLRKKL